MGGIDKYSGLLYCADCNSKLYFIRGTTLKPDAYGFICSRCKKHMGEEQCTPHSIREKVLDEIILEEIRKVTNEQFRMLSDGYNTEQREITERLPIVKQEIEDLKAAATNVERFVDIANKYTDLRELTPEMLRTFIERIIVHERTAKYSETAT